jgi:hypothetical protein
MRQTDGYADRQFCATCPRGAFTSFAGYRSTSLARCRPRPSARSCRSGHWCPDLDAGLTAPWRRIGTAGLRISVVLVGGVTAGVTFPPGSATPRAAQIARSLTGPDRQFCRGQRYVGYGAGAAGATDCTTRSQRARTSFSCCVKSGCSTVMCCTLCICTTGACADTASAATVTPPLAMPETIASATLRMNRTDGRTRSGETSFRRSSSSSETT